MNDWNGTERRVNSCNPNEYVRRDDCLDDRTRIEKDVKDLEVKVERDYLTKELFFSHFKPIRNLLFGAIGLILITVAKWVLALVGFIK